MTTSTSQTMAFSLWLMPMAPMLMASLLIYTCPTFFACLVGSYGVYVTVTPLNYVECLGTAHECLGFIQSLPKVVLVWILVQLFPDYSAGLWWLYEVYFTLTTIFSFVKACAARIKTLGWKEKLLLLFIVLLYVIVPVAANNFDEWHADYAYNHSTFGRDFFKLVAMIVQHMHVPGLHESVTVVMKRFYDGAVYYVMSNPEEVARFLGVVVPANRRETRTTYLYCLMKDWGCIFHYLSGGFFRTTNDLIADATSRWWFRVRTGVLDDANTNVLTDLNLRTLQEATLSMIRQPRGRSLNTIHHDLSPFIVFVIKRKSYTSASQAGGKLSGGAQVKTSWLTALKQRLVDSFYRNPKSFITTEPSYNRSNLSVSGNYTAARTGQVTKVVVKFNRGFTQDDFSR